MFDPKKPHEVCGKGNQTYWSQDGVIYNPSTKEPVDLQKGVAATAAKNADGIACKFCQIVSPTPEAFKEHLISAHPENVPDLIAAGKKTEPEPKPEEPKQMTTESIRQPGRKGSPRKGNKK